MAKLITELVAEFAVVIKTQENMHEFADDANKLAKDGYVPLGEPQAIRDSVGDVSQGAVFLCMWREKDRPMSDERINEIVASTQCVST